MKPPRGEEGTAFVETALVGLVVMALALGLLQFGLFFHAQHMILGAAQEGAHAAALEGAGPLEGEARALDVTRAGLGSLADEVTVSSSVTQRIATLRVEASMGTIVPFLPALTLRAEGRAFKERFMPAMQP